MYYEHHHLPCLHCQPQEYIRMVQHLIERCLLFHMSRDACVRALARHASVHPIVTFTVWEELLRENKSFFQAYFHAISPKHHTSLLGENLTVEEESIGRLLETHESNI